MGSRVSGSHREACKPDSVGLRTEVVRVLRERLASVLGH